MRIILLLFLYNMNASIEMVTTRKLDKAIFCGSPMRIELCSGV
jgi:hypothetical protein